jgi:hypothetical protein
MVKECAHVPRDTPAPGVAEPARDLRGTFRRAAFDHDRWSQAFRAGIHDNVEPATTAGRGIDEVRVIRQVSPCR